MVAKNNNNNNAHNVGVYDRIWGANVTSLLFDMSQIKKASLKPGFEDSYWPGPQFSKIPKISYVLPKFFLSQGVGNS